MGELRVIGKKSTIMVGDSAEEEFRLKWRKGDDESVADAAKMFKEFVENGWLAIGEKSGRKTQIFAFDPEMDKITLAPISIGG